MKQLLLSLSLLAGCSLRLAAQCPVDATHFQKKLGLAPSEVYYISIDDMRARYGDPSRRISFPINPVYDQNGTGMLAQWKTGTKYPLFTCFQIMSKELDSFALQTPGYGLVADTGSIAWAQEHMLPALGGTVKRPLSKYNIVLYYPAGTPKISKYYKSFIKQLHHYQDMGQDMSLYVVLVPIMKQ
jgi:hypothetical protein